MCDGTRPFDGVAEAEESAPLIDALVVLRQQHDLMACSFQLPEVGQDPHLGAAEVARFLDVKPRTVAQWGVRRRLPEPDLVPHGKNLWKRSTILRWAGDTGRLSTQALRAEYEERWKVQPVPYRQGGRIPEPPRPDTYADTTVGHEEDLRPFDGAAEAFAAYVGEFLDEFTSLIDALVILRQRHEFLACSFLLSVAPLAGFREAWDLWGLWADAEPGAMVDRLVPFLGLRQAHRLRFALWGELPTGGATS